MYWVLCFVTTGGVNMEPLAQAGGLAPADASSSDVSDARLEEEFAQFYFDSEAMDFVLEDEDGE